MCYLCGMLRLLSMKMCFNKQKCVPLCQYVIKWQLTVRVRFKLRICKQFNERTDGKHTRFPPVTELFSRCVLQSTDRLECELCELSFCFHLDSNFYTCSMQSDDLFMLEKLRLRWIRFGCAKSVERYTYSNV